MGIRRGAGMNPAWEQDSFGAWKMLENATESQPSAARCVGQVFAISELCVKRNATID